jgi:hypothetical protein
MTDQKTSITGALLPADHPAWIPHRSTDNETAIAALLKHMQRDALQPEFMSERHGLVDIMANEACGNFFWASAGFQIYDLTIAQRARLLDAWSKHKHSRQYVIAVELLRLGARIKEEEAKVPRSHDHWGREQKLSKARWIFLPQVKQLEAEFESIYKAGAS